MRCALFFVIFFFSVRAFRYPYFGRRRSGRKRDQSLSRPKNKLPFVPRAKRETRNGHSRIADCALSRRGNNSRLIKLSPPNLQLSPPIYAGVVHERDKPRDPLFVQVTLVVTIASLSLSLKFVASLDERYSRSASNNSPYYEMLSAHCRYRYDVTRDCLEKINAKFLIKRTKIRHERAYRYTTIEICNLIQRAEFPRTKLAKR